MLGTKQEDRLRAPANFYYISFLGLKASPPVHQNIKRGTKRMRLHLHSTLLWEDPGLDAARLPDLGQGRGFECGGSEKKTQKKQLRVCSFDFESWCFKPKGTMLNLVGHKRKTPGYMLQRLLPVPMLRNRTEAILKDSHNT